MKKRKICQIVRCGLMTALLFTPAFACFAKGKLPVVKANSRELDVRFGEKFYKNGWSANLEYKPSVWNTTTAVGPRVTVYTDLDSISFKMKPKGGSYNFVVLLNGKDSAYMRINYSDDSEYLTTLKKAKKYNKSDNRYVPNFVYESPENASLKALRANYRLDSIAGQGTELSKIINLMYWVHNTIRHDGNCENPQDKSAAALIEICKRENRGVNCRMMATILNECYLAMGIKSRFITCMPRETEFDDCHVINSVYSSDLKKWIWIDPTFAAYVMDEKGELQSIEQVRKKLITGAPLILNPDANWNHQYTQTKEYYLNTYMAKNLYRLQTHVNSRPGAENWSSYPDYTSLELVPLDGIKQTPQVETWDSPVENGGVVKSTSYLTNNPAVFWALPQ